MFVGICRLVLSLPAGTNSLKGKRAVVRRVVGRVRSRFDTAAIAEVADMDVHRRAVLGLAVVSNDARHANSMIDTIVSFVAGSSEAQIVDRAMEITKFGDHLGEGGILGHAGDWPQDDDEEDEFSDDESDENWAPDEWKRDGGDDA